MLSKDTVIEVQNRDIGSVGYVIPDYGSTFHRSFAPGEKKEITMDELRKLSYVPGGRSIIAESLLIKNKTALKELIGDAEPEYFYTEEQIKDLLLNDSVERLQDCLDFAPSGVVDLVKKMAVDLEINNLAKRKVIQEKTGLNVTNAIQNTKNSENEKNENKAQKRRVAPKAEVAASLSKDLVGDK